ncbi:hypothetical protein Tco_0891832 [Tanacetum coccineum]|uniref:Uncharacterized protein n=1 Tax=Tanacetum coccineum TaxID=301880 RepID=A0ABQ5C435_9ASTR
MECLYKEDVDRIFTLDEPFEEMGSEAIEVPALKEEEFAQITMLGLYVFFPIGDALSFVLIREDLNAVYQLMMKMSFGIHSRIGILSVLVDTLVLQSLKKTVLWALELIRFIKKILAELEPEDKG